MTRIIELRPDRKLANVKFEKYQFSTDELPIVSETDLNTGEYYYLLGHTIFYHSAKEYFCNKIFQMYVD